MSTAFARIIAPAIFAALLTACGGGGGSGPSSGVVPTQPTVKPTLVVGFNTGGLRTSSLRRTVKDVTAQIVPTTIVDVPDGYESSLSRQDRGIAQVYAVAYLTVSGGASIPSALPSGSWTQAGVALNTSPFSPGPGFSTTPNILPDGLAVNNTAATFGTTTLTDAVAGYGTASATVLEYPSLGLATASTAGDYLNPQTFAANGLTFGSDGVATPAASTSSADLYMTEDGSGKTTIVFPHSAVVLPAVPTIDQLTTPVGTLPTSTVSSASLANTQSIVEFQIASGEIVKWAPTGFGDEHTSPTTCGATAGCATHISGIYLVTQAHVWSM